MRSHPLPRPRCQFTLIELLVVVAIIAILASLLLPALSAARERSRQSVCQGNMKQVSLAAVIYHDDMEVLPSINTGNYASLGVGGPTFTSWQSYAVRKGQVDSHFAQAFARDYLGASWGFADQTTTVLTAPKVFTCPSINPGLKGAHSWMPGHANGHYQLGEPSYSGGVVMGMASFLGLYHMGNGVVETRYLRLNQFTNPASEVGFLDPLFHAGNVYVGSSALDWNAPHQGANGVPLGLNQGFMDGSVQWISYAKVNKFYRPAYYWDRRVTTPLYLPPDAKFNLGGYPYQNGWVSPPVGWYGVQGIHTGNYAPGT